MNNLSAQCLALPVKVLPPIQCLMDYSRWNRVSMIVFLFLFFDIFYYYDDDGDYGDDNDDDITHLFL